MIFKEVKEELSKPIKKKVKNKNDDKDYFQLKKLPLID